MSDAHIPQRLLGLARQARAPRALTDSGLRERFGAPEDAEISARQVWRARWEAVSVLVLVVTVADREVHAAPVTVDPPAEDDRSLVLSGSSTAFGVDTTVWAGLTAAVPIRVLERAVDAWNEDIVGWVRRVAEGVPGEAPSGTRPGRAIPSELDQARQVRAELVDDLEALQQSPGLPAGISEKPVTDLASKLRGRLDLPSLCQSLDLPQPQVMQILRGKVPLTSDQISAVSQATGLSVDEVEQSVRPLPPGLVVAAEHPRWRSAWQDRARKGRVSVEQARLTGAYGAYGLAARQAGGEPDWNDRLRQFLRGEDDGSGGA